MRRPNGYWTAEKIDSVFDEQVQQLGRVPTGAEFRKKYPGSMNAIARCSYNSTIRSYNAYVRSRGLQPANVIQEWDSETIDATFDAERVRLGRVPTSNEIQTIWKGAIAAIRTGKYSPDVRTYNDYLRSRGLPLNHAYGKWTSEVIDAAFDALRKKLGRVPLQEEFQKENGGAFFRIVQGRYAEGVRNWNQYLYHRGIPLHHEKGKWAPATLDAAFDVFLETLGRTPTYDEFQKGVPGAIKAIERGSYHPDIQSFTTYLRHRGLRPLREVGKWKPEEIDRVFDSRMRKLERVPSHSEFAEKHSGAVKAIARGDYHPDVRTYRTYVLHRGFVPMQPVTSARIRELERILDEFGRQEI